MLRLLCITAHPDDEAGGFGGTLLQARSRGIETHLICLTSGKAATNRGGAKNDDELGTMRRREFAAACEILQITGAVALDYPDGGLDKQDFFAVTGDLTRRMRTIRPHVVITFGTEGAVTAHPDHTMAALFTTAAFQWAGRTNRFPEHLEQEGLLPHRAQKLYYTTANFTMPERQPVSLAPHTAKIDTLPFLEKKIEAFKAHTTQNPLVPIFETMARNRGPHELFHLAAATQPRAMEMESDLFAGVVDE